MQYITFKEGGEGSLYSCTSREKGGRKGLPMLAGAGFKGEL